MKKIVLALMTFCSAVGIATAAQADDPPPPGCEYVLGKLICVDEPIGP